MTRAQTLHPPPTSVRATLALSIAAHTKKNRGGFFYFGQTSILEVVADKISPQQ
jgi:hypothetical protein